MFRKKLSETQETFELSSSLNPMLIQPGLEVQIIRVQPHKLSDLKLFNLKVSTAGLREVALGYTLSPTYAGV